MLFVRSIFGISDDFVHGFGVIELVFCREVEGVAGSLRFNVVLGFGNHLERMISCLSRN